MEIAADVSRFAPFNVYRIEQHYGYEHARLTETVDLIERAGSSDKRFVRNDETAQLFGVTRFERPPTTR